MRITTNSMIHQPGKGNHAADNKTEWEYLAARLNAFFAGKES